MQNIKLSDFKGLEINFFETNDGVNPKYLIVGYTKILSCQRVYAIVVVEYCTDLCKLFRLGVVSGFLMLSPHGQTLTMVLFDFSHVQEPVSIYSRSQIISR